jgi:hypothetical protein
MNKRSSIGEYPEDTSKRPRNSMNNVHRDAFVYKIDDLDQEVDYSTNPWDNTLSMYHKILRYPNSRVHVAPESSIQLDFNYWQQDHCDYLIGSDLSVILTWLLEGENNLK